MSFWYQLGLVRFHSYGPGTSFIRWLEVHWEAVRIRTHSSSEFHTPDTVSLFGASAMVTPLRKTVPKEPCKDIFTQWSGTWLSRGHHTGSTWSLRCTHGAYWKIASLPHIPRITDTYTPINPVIATLKVKSFQRQTWHIGRRLSPFQ